MVSLSWSKVAVAGWIALLALHSVAQGQVVQGLIATIVALSCLQAGHGDAQLIIPLVFLSERCLDERHSLGHSPMNFYAAALTAYLQSCASHPARHHRWSVSLSSLLYIATAAGSFFALTRDGQLSVAFGVATLTAEALHAPLAQALSPREAIVLSSLAGWLAGDAVGNSATTVSFGFFAVTNVEHLASRAALLSALSVAIVAAVLFNIESAQRFLSNRAARTGAVGAVAVICVSIQYVIFNSRRDALAWVFNYCFTTSRARPFVLMMWATGIPLATLFIDLFGSRLPLPEKRKLFHFLSVVAFAPVIIVDADFFRFAIAVAVSIGIIIEVARVCDVVGSRRITAFLANHIDQRDHRIIRTHLYLMFGMGSALIIRGRRTMLIDHGLPLTADLALLMLPGIWSLGLIDAFAAIIGRRFGKRKWSAILCNRFFPVSSNSALAHKTPAGTFGAIAVCCGLWWILASAVLRLSPSWVPYVTIICIGMLETIVEGVDNIELPLFALAALQTLLAIEPVVERHLW